MSGHDVVVVGASAGGLEAVKKLVAGLPADLPATVLVVIHVMPSGPRLLPAILNRLGTLPADYAEDGGHLRRGHVFLAPPDHHLLLHGDAMRLTRGAKENGHRPAVDPLFRSAALSHGPRVIGVILTGNLDDGTRGLSAVKRCGGMTVVQDPADALYPSMPASARQNTPVDHCVPISQMAELLVRLVAAPAEPTTRRPPPLVELEGLMSERQADDEELLDEIGVRSALTCPECHGTLWELKDGDLVEFRCHVGHAYSPDSLLGAHSRGLEETLWAAIRGFEENADIAERIAERERESGDDTLRQRFVDRAHRARQHARKLRQLINALPVTDGVVQSSSA